MFHRQQTETDNVEQTQEQVKEETIKTEVKREDKVMSESQTGQTGNQQTNETQQSEMQSQGAVGTASFQKPVSQAPRIPGSFSGAYPGAPSGSMGGVKSYGAPAESARRLVVGQGITMSGEIESCDMLIVEGTVEAALKGASHLDVTETGVFYGSVEIDEATISGRFEGDLVVNGRLTVTETGSVTGSIAYKELAIEAGATVDGKIMPLSSMAAKGGKETTKSVKSAGPKNDNDTAGELPFSGAAVQAAG